MTQTSDRWERHAWAAGILFVLALVAESGILLSLQGFGLGGVIASFGLVLDLVGFLLLLVFVLVSSIISLRRGTPSGAGSA